MSEHETPVGPLFELQRETLKRGADILNTGRSAREEASTAGLDATETLGTQVLELGRRSLTAPLAVAGAGDDKTLDSLQDAIDETFDTLRTQHDAVYETAAETYEEADTAIALREAEQLSNLLELSERAEAQFAEAVAELEAGPARSDDAVAEFLDQLDRFSARLDAETERYATAEETPHVRCQVCDEEFEGLTYAHLKSHGLTVEEYRDEFGDDVPL
ncbi:hypothetical protein [Halovenus halobia]|uniref:hypothetical protein n=1 Tax=Halovenus halobia TaxID=3396622 RepID=UPI003F56798F